jgi:glycosyltransferase involved in cell wall biosynthesis
LNHKKYKKKSAWFIYQRKDLLSATAFHATSEEESQNIKQMRFEQPVFIVPNGIDFPKVLPLKKKVDTKRKVLFLSRIHFQKGLNELIEAWAKIKPDNWILQISGSDSDNYKAHFVNLTKRFNISNCVQFTGPLGDEEKWITLRQSDVLVLPSYSENFGNIIAEALAAELPVIATKTTPWEEVLCDKIKRTGWWIDLGVDPLVNALTDAINLTDYERHQMGERGREIIKGRYTWTSVSEKMIEAYCAILNMNK